MPISQYELRNKASNYSTYKSASFSAGQTTAFLCHSHKDEELVKGLIVSFQEAGISLYIDWMDSTMPEKPDKITAKRLQERIKSMNIFLFLATDNSVVSRWCPWEIGYADANSKSIFIVPTSQENTDFGNEYLQLYKKIDIGEEQESKKRGLAVFEPGATKGSWLDNLTLR